MNHTETHDLSKKPPRSGRHMLGGWAWLARVADKVRADHAGTPGEYTAYCGLTMGFLNRAGITREQFDEQIRKGATDQELLEHFERTSTPEQKAAANEYVLVAQKHHLDKEDAEEGWTSTP